MFPFNDTDSAAPFFESVSSSDDVTLQLTSPASCIGVKRKTMESQLIAVITNSSNGNNKRHPLAIESC